MKTHGPASRMDSESSRVWGVADGRKLSEHSRSVTLKEGSLYQQRGHHLGSR